MWPFYYLLTASWAESARPTRKMLYIWLCVVAVVAVLVLIEKLWSWPDALVPGPHSFALPPDIQLPE